MASKRRPAFTTVPNGVNRWRLFCQMKYAVLPGRHSHRSTTLERKESRLKSRFGSEKLCAPSVTVYELSGLRTIAVPDAGSPYPRSMRLLAAASSPNLEYLPL